MGLNSPLPVRLPDECRKAAKIRKRRVSPTQKCSKERSGSLSSPVWVTVRSFVDGNNNGLDKMIPRGVLEKAAGFAIFTVVKAGFLLSARAGSGVVIARTMDGTWSPPSAIGLGGFGFGGQMGAEMTDFLIILNNDAAVASFMSAGSLTLGGNLSVAIGPLGRNAEGSGAVSSKGKLAAMYSYSKTKGLFGGVSVEGSVIVERQDANRLAYGGNPSSKQILSGSFDPPEWANVLIDQLNKCTGMPGGQVWRDHDEDGEGGGMGDRTNGGGYAFGEGRGATGSVSNRKRSGSLFSTKDKEREGSVTGGSGSPRPGTPGRRTSSFNPFSTSAASPKRATLPSSESYNAGLTWDSSGPMPGYGSRSRSGSNATPNTGYGNRSRSGSSALRPIEPEKSKSPFETETPSLLGGWDDEPTKPIDQGETDLLGTWDTKEGNNGSLSATFKRMSLVNGVRGRSNSKPRQLEDLDEVISADNTTLERDRSDSRSRRLEEYLPKESTSTFADQDWALPITTDHGGGKSAVKFENNLLRKENSNSGGYRNDRPYSSLTSPVPAAGRGVIASNGGDHHDRPFGQYIDPMPPKPNLPLKSGLENNDGYPRAVAIFAFQATDADDLGLTKGQVVMVLDKVGSGDWWMGRGVDGRQGIFPKDYVEVVEIPKDLKGGLTRSELRARIQELEFE
ncbi:SH3 domain-containing YSC84-like protein 1, partial [Tremellales sp. Uapishka_1]